MGSSAATNLDVGRSAAEAPGQVQLLGHVLFVVAGAAQAACKRSRGQHFASWDRLGHQFGSLLDGLSCVLQRAMSRPLKRVLRLRSVGPPVPAVSGEVSRVPGAVRGAALAAVT